MNRYQRPLTISALLFGALAILVSAFSVTGGFKTAMQLTGQGQQLLDESWDAMPGSTFKDGSLTISHHDRAVRTLDDTYLKNLSALLYGKHIQAQGDVSVEFAVSERTGTAIVQLFSKPPLIMDEQILLYPYVEVAVSDAQVTVNAWQQSTSKPGFSKSVSRGNMPAATVTVARENGEITVAVDGADTVTIPGNSSLPGSELWFGASSEPAGGSWQLSGVIGKSLDSKPASIVDTRDTSFARTANGLQETAARQRADFTVGAAVSLMPAVSDAGYGQNAFGGDFGQITTENALKMQFVQPKRGVYDFAEAEALVNLAKKHGMTVHGHALVFGEANPAWLQKLPKEDVEAVMLDHVKTTVSHFKDSIQSWDVINEPLANYDAFTDSDTLRKHVWHQAMGPTYIEKALRAAHEANPNADLWINDFGLEGSPSDGGDSERWDAMVKLVTDLKSKSVPLTGVGFQSHVYELGDEVSSQVFQGRLAQLETLGLKARVSELDVHNDAGRIAQAAQFNTVVKACFTHKNCTGVSTWGVNDAYGSTGSVEGTNFYPGDGLLWDAKNIKLPAYESFKQALQDAGGAANNSAPTTQPSISPTPTPTPTKLSPIVTTPVTTVTPSITPAPSGIATGTGSGSTGTDQPAAPSPAALTAATPTPSIVPEENAPDTHKNKDNGRGHTRRKSFERFTWLRRFFDFFNFRSYGQN